MDGSVKKPKNGQLSAEVLYEVLAYFSRPELVQLIQMSKVLQQHISLHFTLFPLSINRTSRLYMSADGCFKSCTIYDLKKQKLSSNVWHMLTHRYLRFEYTQISMSYSAGQPIPDLKEWKHLWNGQKLELFFNNCVSAEFLEKTVTNLANSSNRLQLLRITNWNSSFDSHIISLSHVLTADFETILFKSVLCKPNDIVEYLHSSSTFQHKKFIIVSAESLDKQYAMQLLHLLQQKFKRATSTCSFKITLNFDYPQLRRLENSTTMEYLEVAKSDCSRRYHNIIREKILWQMLSPFKDNSKKDSTELYPLHKAVFHNDLRKMEALLRSGCDINKQDVHGNTPLHIATILGHRDAINQLLERKAMTRLKNNGGWSSLLEAVSYGDRQIITSLLSASKSEAFEVLASRKPHLLKMLNSLGDFYLELKWDFQTWIPLLSKILPSDTCKIFKKGSAIRMDTTLVSFNERNWDRGDVSLLYNPVQESSGKHLVIMDNKKQVYQKIRHKASQNELNEQVDIMMSNDIVALQMSTKPITFVRAMAGWFFKHEKSERVGGFASDYYMVDGLTVVTRKRREHLTAEDVKKNKAFIQEFATGTFRSNGSTNTLNSATTGISEDVDDSKSRKSLTPPPKPSISWQEYITSTEKPPPIGRPHVEKTNSKEFKAVVAMSQDFPLPVTVLLDILEIVSPFKHIGKLKDFCNARLPPGFPVKLEIPLLPTISAKVTFQKFEWRDDLITKFFCIPRSYAEDSKRFPDL